MSQSQVAFLDSSFINKLTGTFQQYTDSQCALQAPFLNDSRAVVVQKLDPAQMETLHLHFFTPTSFKSQSGFKNLRSAQCSE